MRVQLTCHLGAWPLMSAPARDGQGRSGHAAERVGEVGLFPGEAAEQFPDLRHLRPRRSAQTVRRVEWRADASQNTRSSSARFVRHPAVAMSTITACAGWDRIKRRSTHAQTGGGAMLVLVGVDVLVRVGVGVAVFSAGHSPPVSACTPVTVPERTIAVALPALKFVT